MAASKNQRENQRRFERSEKGIATKRHYRTLHREDAIAAQRKLENRRRHLVKLYKVFWGCLDCGVDDSEVLELDHRDPSTKNAVRIRKASRRAGNSIMVEWSKLSYEDLWTELAKCDVVCANCHKRRTAETFGWEVLHNAVPA